MLISIIIPHRNTPKKLERLLDSIPNNDSIEVVIVDDNSYKDLSATTVKNKKTNMRFVDNLDDSNAGAARNYGLNYAKGDWIIFADADDSFLNDAFMVLIDKLKSDVPCDVIFFKCTALKDSNNFLGTRTDYYNKLIDDYTPNTKEIAYKWVVPWGKVIKANLLYKNNIQFDSRSASNDVMFSLKLAHIATSISIIDKHLYCCYESSDSLTATLTPVKAIHRLGALVDRNEFIKRKKLNLEKDIGLKYFIASYPLFLNVQKLKLYFRWLISLIDIIITRIVKYIFKR